MSILIPRVIFWVSVTCCRGAYTRCLRSVADAVLACASASCSADTQIKLWDSQNQWKCIKTLAGHEHVVSAVRFLPNGTQLVSASRDQTIRLWEASSG